MAIALPSFSDAGMMVKDKAASRATAEASQPKYRLLYLLKRGHNAAKAGLEELLRAQNLSSSEYTALSFLKAMQPCSTADLARAQRISPQAATQQLAQLKAGALASTGPSATNRRIALISLTDEGLRRFDAVDAAARRLEEAMMEELTPLERGMVLTLMRKLILSAERRGPNPSEI